jgi:CheY-like chemotaxis protein
VIARRASLRGRARPDGARETVLVVDKDSLNRSVVRSVLEYNDYFVLEARDISEAVAIAKSPTLKIHALLVDLSTAGALPDRSVARILQGRSGVRCIYMISPSNAKLVNELMLTAVVAKPVGVRTLLETLRQALDEDRAPPAPSDDE